MPEDKDLVIDDNFIRQYSSNSETIKFVKKKFKHISRVGAINLIKLILQQNIHIKITMIQPKFKKFFQYNKGKFDVNLEIKSEVLKDLRLTLNGFLGLIGKEPIIYDKADNKNWDLDGDDNYIVDKYTLFENVRKLICDEGGVLSFHYNFNETDLELLPPKNSDVLQKVLVQVMSNPIKFDFPIEYRYSCPQCGEVTNMKAYEVASTKAKIKCPGILSYVDSKGDSKSKLCGMFLDPDSEISVVKDAYYYDISYEDEEGNKYSAAAISFLDIKPGFYETVIFKIKNPKKVEMYFLIDIKNLKNNEFILPEKSEENYIYTLQKSFDEYIRRQTGMRIYGLNPIKVALIMQKVVGELNLKRVFNVQVIGDPSTGKSTVLKYYLFLLNNNFNLSTNGLSISVPGLRGTKSSIMLMGKESKIITTGYLGTFKSIQIDEAGENKELVQNLKTFLLEDNYGYDKAGATGVFNKRIAQFALSENLSYEHVGQYNGSIRKAYRESTQDFEGFKKDQWDNNEDLFKPIYEYVNPYLRKVIRDKRAELTMKQIWWIDGYEMPLHERFPFYFYLTNEKNDPKLAEVVKRNTSRNTISENLELMKILRCEGIDSFFKGLKDFVHGTNEFASFEKVDKILEDYGIKADARMKAFYYSLIKASRIINQRLTTEEQDYDLLKWFVEKMNCKLDVVDTCDYKINGVYNKADIRRMDEEIDASAKSVGENFNDFGGNQNFLQY